VKIVISVIFLAYRLEVILIMDLMECVVFKRVPLPLYLTDFTGVVYAAAQIQVQYLPVLLHVLKATNIYLELAQSFQLKFAQIVPPISLVITWACLVVAV
jgi:hypothetical protein